MADNNNQAGPSRGNRPADNARQATPSSLSTQLNWQGSGDGLDFLGLNEPEPAPAAAAPAQVKAADDSWLLDDSPSGGSPAEETPLAEAEQVDDGGEDFDDEPIPAMAAPSVLDASWTEERASKGSSKKPALAIAACVGVLAVAGFVLLKPGMPREPAAELAQATSTNKVATPEPVKPVETQVEMPKPVESLAGAARAQTEGRRALDRSGNKTATPPPPAFEPLESAPKSQPPTKPQQEPQPEPIAVEVASAPARFVPAPVPAAPLRPKFQATSEAPKAAQDKLALDKAALDTKLPPAAVTPDPSIVAKASAPELVQKPAPAPVQEEPAPPIADPVSLVEAAKEPEPSVRVIASSSEPIAETSKARPAIDEHLGGVPTEVVAPPLPEAPAPVVAVTDPGPVQPGVVSREGSIPVNDVLLPPAPLTGVRTAQAADMMTVWNGDTIPMDRVGSKFKVMTPNVGNVRVTLKSKDVFEGTLYAVGEDSVWVEGPFGRMGLDNARIATVTKLAPDPKLPATAQGPGAAPGGNRVRVMTPGGAVFGRVVSVDGQSTKLITDAGLKLTVNSKDVESLDQAPRIVVKKDAPQN